MSHICDPSYASQLDSEDSLRPFRDEFLFPEHSDGRSLTYLCGNSLGIQPRRVRAEMEQVLADWGFLAVQGHYEGRDPWSTYHEKFSDLLTEIVGAHRDEIVVMNSLTTNLHLMMVSFYRPTPARHKILIESGAFPSDRYVVASQAAYHGFAPRRAVVELQPRYGESRLRTDDITARIEQLGDELALVMLGGVNYYTGQLFDIPKITTAARRVGATVGFDLGHAAGNVPLRLHDWGVDFAAWCSYKYLNGGPGATAGCFVHRRFAQAPELPRFAGWWGCASKSRFTSETAFVPKHGAAGWQLSNPPVLSMAPLKASLHLFNQAGMTALRLKSLGLTNYLLNLVDHIDAEQLNVLTPRCADERGCQVSLKAPGKGRELVNALRACRVICDYREPDVIRVAPVPLYNSYTDVWRFCTILRDIIT